jgi:hypothetical protein
MVDDDDVTRLFEKKAVKDAKKQEGREKFKESVEKGEKRLVAERTPSGLYYVVFKGGGTIPDELKGHFTSISRIREKVLARYGKDILA